jgi:hypothetical protein
VAWGKLAKVDPSLKPMFAFDSNKIHKYSALAKKSITPRELELLLFLILVTWGSRKVMTAGRDPHPTVKQLQLLLPYSPDMHNVIEHVCAILKRHLQAEMLRTTPASLKSAFAEHMVKAYFKGGISNVGMSCLCFSQSHILQACVLAKASVCVCVRANATCVEMLVFFRLGSQG